VKISATFAALACLAPLVLPAQAPLQTDRAFGQLEVVARFDSGPIPTGVTVSKHGRIFLNFPHWVDTVDVTVVELKDGKTVAYPEGLPQSGPAAPADKLMSAQSVVVDQKNRLWILDTGRMAGAPAPSGGPKLIGVDLATNKVFQKILFPAEIASAGSYLNDVRFDYSRGAAGFAYITDSSFLSPGIVVVDLATGKSWRRLAHHPSTAADPTFQPYVEGEQLIDSGADLKPFHPKSASDGIALSADHKWIYYCPLISRHLYRVSAALLADPAATEAAVAKTVEDVGDKGMSDGMESDREGNIYFGDLEGNSIRRLRPDGRFELIAHDPRILWADTLSLANDGYLYFTANQLNRMPRFHGGKDQRVLPYVLFRVKIDGHPID
jgi:sugar lactone lactonase YvrE